MSNRLDQTFRRLRAAGEVGLFPYLMTGFPDRTASAQLLDAIAGSGADGLELGIPFSDPLADGVTLQRASARALEGHVTLADALQLVRDLRRRRELPVVLMSYVNPLLAYGFERFCTDAASAGLDGVIVPDVPFEEASHYQAACRREGLHYIYMVAPTSGPSRLAEVARHASGFVYCVALLGTTGARADLAPELPAFLAEARRTIETPLVAGFGIASPAHVAALAGQVDGVIVASALADLIETTNPADLVNAVGSFIAELKGPTRSATTVAER